MFHRLTLSLLSASLGVLGPLSSAWAESGTAVTSTFPREAALQYLAPSGAIRQGEVVAVLDCTPITAQLKIVQENLTAAKEAHSSANEKLAIAEAIRKARQESTLEAITTAERELAKYKENDGPGTEVALKLALHDAETEFKKQEERYESRDRLLAEGFIQKVEYDNEETRLKRTQLALEAAKLKMTAFQKYEREAREALLTLTLKKAHEEQQTAEKTSQSALLEAAKAAEAAALAVETLEEEQAALTSQLNQTIIRASKGGRFQQATSGKSKAETAPTLSRGDLITSGQLVGQIVE